MAESSNEKFAARTAERVAEVERELTRRHEEATAVAVGKAVAAEQARQAAGFSIAKSAVKVCFCIVFFFFLFACWLSR